MKSVKKLISFIGIFSLVFVILACGNKKSSEQKVQKQSNKSKVEQAQTESAAAPGEMGGKAPNFQLNNLQEKQVELKDFKGEVVLLNFWGIWCPPCKKEIPELIEIQKENKAKEFSIVSIALPRGPVSGIKDFVQKNNINYPVLVGQGNALKSIMEKYGGIRGVPTTFLIDNKGVIQHKWVGPRSKEQFMQEINKLIK